MPSTCAAQLPQALFVPQVDRLAIDAHLTGNDMQAMRQQADQGQDRHRLAAAGFADDSERLAGREIEIEAVDDRALDAGCR